jgi:hypothetical protein
MKTKAEIAATRAAYYQAHKAESAAQRIAYRAAHKSEMAAANAAYYATHKSEAHTRSAASKRHYPERVRARNAVRIEVRAFRFPPANTMVCDMCGEALAAHWHHHNGYAPEHALDVIAVCIECHVETHKQGGRGMKWLILLPAVALIVLCRIAG